jgi:hypothetical protein
MQRRSLIVIESPEKSRLFEETSLIPTSNHHQPNTIMNLFFAATP